MDDINFTHFDLIAYENVTHFEGKYIPVLNHYLLFASPAGDNHD